MSATDGAVVRDERSGTDVRLFPPSPVMRQYAHHMKYSNVGAGEFQFLRKHPMTWYPQKP